MSGEQMEATTTAAVEPASAPEVAPAETLDWGKIEDGIAADEAEEQGLTVEGAVEVLPEPAAEPAPVVEAAPVPAPAPVAAPAPVVPAAPPFDPVAWETAQMAALEKMYQLKDEDAQALVTEPERILPKLLAQLHMQATKGMLQSMQTAVPQIVQRTQSATQVETEARQAFFKENEDLAKPEYEQAILQMGTMFRQVNPTAPREEAVKKIGELVRVSMGLPAKTASQPLESSAAPVPFTPARGGTGGAVKAPDNVWAALAAEFEQD